MRKLTIVILVLALALTVVFATTACSGDTDLPGRSWTAKEILVYEVYAGNTKAGTMTMTTERLPKGECTLNATGDKYTITSTSAGGTRVTIEVRDLDGNVMMHSESLLNGFTSLASYKEIHRDGTDTVIKSRYDGKRYYYSVNGGSEKKIKEKSSSFVENELVYTTVRCYTIDSGSYSATYKVSDPLNGSIYSIAVATQATDVYYRGTQQLNSDNQTTSCVRTTDGNGNVNYVESVKCVTLRFQRSEAPVGTPVYVTYAVSGNGGLDVSGEGSQGTTSTKIPVKIVENDITYQLSSVTCA